MRLVTCVLVFVLHVIDLGPVYVLQVSRDNGGHTAVMVCSGHDSHTPVMVCLESSITICSFVLQVTALHAIHQSIPRSLSEYYSTHFWNYHLFH